MGRQPMARRQVRIGGELVSTDQWVEVVNPYTKQVIAEVPLCGEEQVDAACATAAAALAGTRFPQHERARVLERAADLVSRDRERLARVLAEEAAKPVRAARAEVDRCADTLRFAAVEARTLAGEMIPVEASSFGDGKVMFALPVPLGVVAAITPFNFPLNLVAHKLAPAIAAGCPVVLKPAPQAPLSALELVETLIEAGLPTDWISVVTDAGKEAGVPLVSHPTPRMVTFTGSSHVGWQIAAQAPRKRVALELGSNAPLIVEPEADLKLVAEKAAGGAFGYAGQSCISVQRVLVHESVAGGLIDALAAETDSLRVGDPLDESTDVGPLIDDAQTERVLQWIDEAVAMGATVVSGGKPEGVALRPTVLADVPPEARVSCQEVFGPVLVVNTYADFDEALARANDTHLALHAGVFTRDVEKAMKAASMLDFGGVHINDIPTFRADQQPYGGLREAGNTREGPRYTVREMTELRVVSLPR